MAITFVVARISCVTWTPNDEEELRWRFDGSAEAALGMRSWLGPMIDRRASGATGPGADPALRDYGAAAERMAAVDKVLARVSEASPRGARHVRALKAQYGAEPAGLEGLDHLTLAPLMLALGGLSGSTLKARHCKALASDPKAMLSVVELQARAERALADAQQAYGEAKERPEETPARLERRAKQSAERERERRAAFAGRVDARGAVVFPGAAGRLGARWPRRFISVAI